MRSLQAAAETEQVQVIGEELEKIFRDHHGMVFRAAHRITGNVTDAEDVLQSVFLRLLRREPDTEPLKHIESYLHRAAVNTALDLMRSRHRAPSISLDDVPIQLADDASHAPDRALSSAEIRDWLRKTIARLSPMAAEIFALRFFEGKDNLEIASILGTTYGTVTVTLSRTRDRIEKEFRLFMGGKA
jgi:RNA polymerase sigma-70 factor (ECF subfamily)